MNDGQVAAKLVDGEAIVIDLASGTYYSLAGTGALVWGLAERGGSEEEIAAELERRFGAAAGEAREDVRRLLAELVDEGILVAADGAPAGPGPSDSELPDLSTYERPVLDKYTDMSDLLALDPPMPGLRDIPWQAPPG